MSIQVQHRRDSRTNCEAATPAAGELWFDTTLAAFRVGTGALLGGLLMKRWGYSYPLSPSQITSDQNNYSPTDLSIAETVFLNSDAARTLTGLATGVAGRRITLVNRGAFDITLSNNSASSTAGNRFLFESDVVIRPNGSMELQYSATDSRWMRAAGGTKFSTIPQELLLTGSISPAQITANQNDYTPTSIALASTLRLNTDASRNITGLVDPRDGSEKTIINVGSNAIVFKNADSGSSANNRFDFGGDVTLSAKQSIRIRYDGTDNRWKLLSSTAGASVSDAAVSAVKLGTTAFGMRSGMINGAIVESHASNAVIFAIKTLAGSDPSASDPVRVVFQNGSGGYVVRDITAALSVTISSGSTMGFNNAEASRLWLVLIDTGSGVVLGVVNCRSGINVIALLDGITYSTTAEGGSGAADSSQVIYSTASQTSKYLCIAGYADYDSGLTTAGTWAASPTRLVLFGSSTPRPGALVQQRYAQDGALASGTTIIPLDNTLPQSTEGTQFATLAITPLSAANVIEVGAQQELSAPTQVTITTALFKDSGTDALSAATGLVNGNYFTPNLILHRILAAVGGTAQTFKLRSGPHSAATVYLNGQNGSAYFSGVWNSWVKIKEFMG